VKLACPSATVKDAVLARLLYVMLSHSCCPGVLVWLSLEGCVKCGVLFFELLGGGGLADGGGRGGVMDIGEGEG
jgi:hypothetical protein